MKGGIGNLLKQAQEMQSKMQQAQEELANLTVKGEAGGGLLTVEMNGKHATKRVTVDDSLLKEEKEILEDLIAAAINDAVRKVEKASQEKLSKLTAGMKLPEGFGDIAGSSH